MVFSFSGQRAFFAARHGSSPGQPGRPSFPGWLDCLADPDFPAGLTAWLLRNFSSRFDDDAPLPPIAVGTSCFC